MTTARSFITAQYRNDEREEVGIAGFLLMARVNERYSLSNDIPTTFLEDGSHINDHIIRNPLIIDIEGSVADVHLRPAPQQPDTTRETPNIGALTAYLPARTQYQLSRISAFVNDLDAANERVNLALQQGRQPVGFIGSSQKSNTESFIDMIDAIYNSGMLISIDMPFRTYDLMCITDVEIGRDNVDKALYFSISAQQFRFAETQTVEAGADITTVDAEGNTTTTAATKNPAPNPSSSTGGQTEGKKEKGAQAGEKKSSSFAASSLRKIKGLF